MKHIIKLILSVLLLLVVVLGTWYWLERLNVINTNIITNLVNSILPRNKNVDPVVLLNEDNLVDKLRLEKKEEEIKKLQIELSEQRQNLELQSQELAQKISTLELARSDLESQKKSLNEISKNFENRNEKLRSIAKNLMNMPPQNAVQIIAVYDDELIVDTLLAVEDISSEEGLASIVPFWLSLMDPNRAGQVQKKLIEMNR